MRQHLIEQCRAMIRDGRYLGLQPEFEAIDTLTQRIAQGMAEDDARERANFGVADWEDVVEHPERWSDCD